MIATVDPLSPVPVFHQIAEGVRYRVAVGELGPGDSLPSVRAAAVELGVHYHTVRRAYADLEAEGYVRSERGRGTWIRRSLGGRGGARGGSRGDPSARGTSGRSTPAELMRFLERVEREARTRHDLGPDALGRLILARAGRAPGVLHVVECNRPQAEDYAEQIREAIGVEVRPWLLSEGEPPEGLVVAPYFHLGDVRAAWPDRVAEIRFVAAELASGLEHRLLLLADEGVRRVVVHDPRADRVHPVLEDVRGRLVQGRLEVVSGGLTDPERLLWDEDAVVVFTPRTWAGLPDEVRQHPRAVQLGYRIRREDLEELRGLVQVGRESGARAP